MTKVRQQVTGETTSVRQQGLGADMASKRQQAKWDTTRVRQQDGGAETCCRTLAVTPMRHKGLMGWRYDCKCNYMITLVTEPRSSIFGRLCEWGVEWSGEGRAVFDAWQEIEAEFPGVRATYNSIMPDHFHGIVYVTFDGAAGLDEVVAFFAGEVERRIGRRVWCGLWRDSICLAKGQLHRQINYVVSNAKRRWIKENNPGLFRKVMGFSHWRLDCANETLNEVAVSGGWDFRRIAHNLESEYWNIETGEEILKPRKANRPQRAFGEQQEEYGNKGGARGGQQAYDNKGGAGRQQAYDNKAWARRWVGARQQAYDNKMGQQAYDNKGGGGTTCCRTLAVSSGVVWTALGNPFLLDMSLVVSVRIPEQTQPDELDRLVARIVSKAERGAVMVSPWISPGEKLVKAAVAEAGGMIVQLLSEGMGRYYKPSGRDFDLCVGGRMLQLSPFAPREEGDGRVNCDKSCLDWLYFVAKAMGDLAMGFSHSQSGETTSVRQQGLGAAMGRGETTSVRQQDCGAETCCRTLAVPQPPGAATTSTMLAVEKGATK